MRKEFINYQNYEALTAHWNRVVDYIDRESREHDSLIRRGRGHALNFDPIPETFDPAHLYCIYIAQYRGGGVIFKYPDIIRLTKKDLRFIRYFGKSSKNRYRRLFRKYAILQTNPMQINNGVSELIQEMSYKAPYRSLETVPINRNSTPPYNLLERAITEFIQNGYEDIFRSPTGVLRDIKILPMLFGVKVSLSEDMYPSFKPFTLTKKEAKHFLYKNKLNNRLKNRLKEVFSEDEMEEIMGAIHAGID